MNLVAVLHAGNSSSCAVAVKLISGLAQRLVGASGAMEELKVPEGARATTSAEEKLPQSVSERKSSCSAPLGIAEGTHGPPKVRGGGLGTSGLHDGRSTKQSPRNTGAGPESPGRASNIQARAQIVPSQGACRFA